MKIVHMTSAHPSDDNRIFNKMCISLAQSQFEIFLIVNDGSKTRKIKNVNIVSVGFSRSRFERITFGALKTFLRALKLNADIYHMHDPELIPFGLIMRLLGKVVIFDVHESFELVPYSRYYIPIFIAKYISYFIRLLMFISLNCFSGLISATPIIAKSLSFVKKPNEVIFNYVKISEFKTRNYKTINEKGFLHLVYVGAVSFSRGIKEVIEAVSNSELPIKISIVGNRFNEESKLFLRKYKNSNKIELTGHLNRTELGRFLSNCDLGILTFHPYPNHKDAIPNKLFEYMAASLPILASNFTLWEQILVASKSGIVVDPQDPKAIEKGIEFIFHNQDLAKEMGSNGRQIASKNYSWESQILKLINFYKKVLNSK